MTSRTMHVAFLRGINVGGYNRISKEELVDCATRAGFDEVRIYLNSGNIIFDSSRPEPELKTSLEKELSGRTGKDIIVVVRNDREIGRTVQENPFPEAEKSRVGVLLTDVTLPKNIMKDFFVP